jgi:hypothetical protein
VLEGVLRGAELVIIVWAAAPHVLSAVSHMRALTQQLSSDAQQGVQRPTRVRQVLHALQLHASYRGYIHQYSEILYPVCRTCGSS